MRTALLVLVIAACGGGGSGRPIGELEQQCRDAAAQYCCGLDGTDGDECINRARFAVCGAYGAGSVAPCTLDGLCIRTNVDFAACSAALDAAALCDCGYDVDGGTRTCGGNTALFPAACQLDEGACDSLTGGCREDPLPWSDSPAPH